MAKGRRSRKRPLSGAGDLVVDALLQAGLTEQARRLRIARAWDEAVGPDIAARTAPETLSRGVLTVCAKNAAWQNELTFLKKDIITRVNTFLGQEWVKDLRIKSGVIVPLRTVEPKPPPPPPPSREDRDEAALCARGIIDQGVRQQFEELMARHLCHSRRAER